MTTSEMRHLLVLLVAGLMASLAESYVKLEEYMTTQAERIEFIKAHNGVRNDLDSIYPMQPPASNMNRIYWSLLLEASATDWARQCRKDVHGQTEIIKGGAFKNFTTKFGIQFGQNMFGTSASTKPNATGLVTTWSNEAVNYKYVLNGSGPCAEGKVCGHYTQVVWADSYYIGCGFYRCDGEWRSYCNYAPPGNWVGASPYKAGTPCIECATTNSGFNECERKLCVPKDRCSPNTDCKVVDLEHCLCSDEENKKLVTALLNHANSNYQIASVTVILSLLASAAVLFDVTL